MKFIRFRMTAVVSLLLSIMVSISVSAESKNAFYIYRNDGGFNAFLINEVVRMGFSPVGEDSVTCDHNVVHEIETVDSLYRIPVAAIDSVSFITPETVVKPNAIDISDLVDKYLVEQQGLSLLFKSDFPANALSVGDKVFTTNTSEIIPCGFIGSVSSIEPNGELTTINCDLLYPDEVFDSYYCVFEDDEDDGMETRAEESTDVPQTTPFIKYTFDIAKIKEDFDLETSDLSGDMSENMLFKNQQPSARYSSENKIKFTGVLIADKKLGNYFKLSYVFTDNFNVNMTGSYHMEGQCSGSTRTKNIATPWTFMYPSVDYDIYAKIYGDFQCEDFKFGGTLIVSGSFEGNIDSKKDEDAFLKSKVPTVKFIPANSGNFIGDGTISFQLEPDIDMSFPVPNAIGAYSSSRIKLIMNDDNCPQMSIDDMKKGTDGYDYLMTLNDIEIVGDVNGTTRGFKGFHKDYPRQITYAVWEKDSYESTFINENYMKVPAFIKNNEKKKDVLSTTAVGKVFVPVKVGAALKQNDESLNYQAYHEKFHSVLTDYTVDFSGKKTDEMEEVPMVKWCGIELQARFDDFKCDNDNHPHAVDLGLPSGTKWCCMNVDASQPHEYGGYYAWGDLVPERPVTDFFYKQNNSYHHGIRHHWGSDISGTEHDVATVRMGNKWRTPTHKEVEEMWKHCTFSFVRVHGVKGFIFMGPNGNKIFLPGAGHIEYGGNEFRNYGQADYWTSTSHETNDEYAWGLLLKDPTGGIEEQYPTPYPKDNGLYVRPVLAK